MTNNFLFGEQLTDLPVLLMSYFSAEQDGTFSCFVLEIHANEMECLSHASTCRVVL